MSNKNEYTPNDFSCLHFIASTISLPFDNAKTAHILTVQVILTIKHVKKILPSSHLKMNKEYNLEKYTLKYT